MQTLSIESRLITDNGKLWKPENYPFTPNVVQERLAAGELVRMFGPCSVTSTEQVLAILRIVGAHADLVRAPGRKPRTRPVDDHGNLLFEGIGMEAAAKVMAEVRQQFPQVLFASELMQKGDILPIQRFLGLGWSGSRKQDQNELRDLGADMYQAELPLMVKNPLPDSLELMVGMLENAILGGQFVVPVMLGLRGFHPKNETEQALWRNTPNLDLIPHLKRIFPDLPIIVDGSHQLKKADLTPTKVAQLVKQGIEEGANGYIVEVSTREYPSKTDPGTDASETMEVFDKLNLL